MPKSHPMVLIDEVYKLTFKKQTINGWRSNVTMRHAFEQAHRFVADKPMSRFMADLSTEAFANAAKNFKMFGKVADSLRLQARLPHETIWIEYWLRDYQDRRNQLGGPYGDPNETPVKEGWLIQQHPTINTAHIMHSFTWSDEADSKGFNMWTFPFAFAWRCDDGPLPWEVIGHSAKIKPETDLCSILYGVPEGVYPREAVDLVIGPLIKWPDCSTEERATIYANLVLEWKGVLRRAWALLATIDHLPVSYATTRTARGFLGEHRIRRPLDHKTITLRIPERKDTRVVARKLIAHAHHKRHEVRAHWRDSFRHPPSKDCNPHIWEMVGDDADTIECSVCHGRQFQIHKYERGDASLGYVFHDYELRH